MKVLERFLKLLLGMGVVFCSYFLGELASYIMRGFISPSVSGMVILFILLKTGLVKKGWVEESATLLTSNIILFFVPVTVGVVLIPMSVWKQDGIAMVTALILSTLLVLWVTGVIADKGIK